MRRLRRSTMLLLLTALVVAAVGCTRLPAVRDARATAGAATEGSSDDEGLGVDEGGGTAEAGSPEPLPTLSAEDLAQQLVDSDEKRRLSAAWDVPERDDIPVQERVDLLITGLSREVAEPTQAPQRRGRYLPASAFVRLHFTRAMSELGAEAIPALQAAASDASGEKREHLLIALAYAGDRDVLPQVRDLVTQASSPAVRMDAARALGQAGDQDAVTQLQVALGDRHVVTAEDDLGSYTIYPVREQAAAALRALGVTVVRQADGAFEIGE